MDVTADGLDEFVQECDRLVLGSKECQEFISGFRYVSATQPDITLDPFGDHYFFQQIELYNEISGRELDQSVNENTVFPLEIHEQAPNPYCNISPTDASIHMTRLLKVYRAANLAYAANVLDMGAGWGLSSEIAAYIGCNVTAVDINPSFVELISRRQQRLKFAIDPVCSTFDDFKSDRLFDLIFFYECLHHATRPWQSIERLSKYLAAGGKIGFVGEPVNAHWWPNWGLRLDPISVYCIRKHGWFESGWSLDFIISCFTRNGMHVDVIEDPDPIIGQAAIAYFK